MLFQQTAQSTVICTKENLQYNKDRKLAIPNDTRVPEDKKWSMGINFNEVT